MRVLHVITGPLGIGGAELMLQRLLEASDREADTHEVVSLTELGSVAEAIQALGVRTVAIGMSHSGVRYPEPRGMLRLVRHVRAFRPDVVQTWLYHADLLGGLAARAVGGARIFWGLHNGMVDPVRTRRTTRWTVRALARLSRWVPDAIVTVSRTARDVHVAAGYDPSRFVYIPNGFDLGEFRPDPEARAAVRAELGVGDDVPLVGMAARLDPMKDHENLVRAAAILCGRRPDARFVLCGNGITPDEPRLSTWLARHRLMDRFFLLGRRSDMPRLLAALDVGTLSSAGEAFPLAIGETMACGVPCVVTDVGDCAEIVGDTGRVVPPRHPRALADGWEALLALDPGARRRLGRAARERVETRFALPRVAARYAELYRRAVGAAARGRAQGPENAATPPAVRIFPP